MPNELHAIATSGSLNSKEKQRKIAALIKLKHGNVWYTMIIT